MFKRRLGILKIVGLIIATAILLFFVFKASISGSIV